MGMTISGLFSVIIPGWNFHLINNVAQRPLGPLYSHLDTFGINLLYELDAGSGEHKGRETWSFQPYLTGIELLHHGFGGDEKLK